MLKEEIMTTAIDKLLIVVIGNIAVCLGLSCMQATIHDETSRCTDLDIYHLSSVNISCKMDINFSGANLLWTLVDSFQGSLEVSVSLPQEDCKPMSQFKIDLLTDEDLDEATCLLPSNSLLRQHHSCRQFSANVCSETNDICSKSVTVPFNYVYTGCYQFRIESGGYRNHTPRYYITTNYTKSGVDNVIFDFTYRENSELDVKIKMASPFVPSLSKIEFMKDVDPDEDYPCDKSGTLHATCYTCLNKTEVYCKLEDKEGLPPKCTYERYNAFNCKFYHIPPMNYCVKVSYEDDRCQALSVWEKNDGTSNCSMSRLHTATEIKSGGVIKSDLEPLVGAKEIMLISALIVFMAIALVYISFFIYKHQRYQPKKNWLVSKISDDTDEASPVVLLYSRDCPLFMAAMSKLRTVLKSFGCSEVYDYWDPERLNEVAEDSCGWLRKLVQDTNVRFIYVATTISHSLEQSVVDSTLRVEFKEPHCFDNLFLFALKCLEQTIVTESYKRIFVVRIQSGTEDRLTYLNPLTEYCLSGRTNCHLHKLIHDIKNKSSVEFTDMPKVYVSEDVDELNSLLLQLASKSDMSDIVNVYHIK